MRSSKIVFPILFLALVSVLVSVLPAQEKQEEKNLTGDFSFGYRAVDTSGAANKYREHINLDKGVRLFNFNLSYVAKDGLKKLFDRIDVNAVNLGGDPYERLGLAIQKFGRYKFKYDHKKSAYFYGDLNETRTGGLFDAALFNFDRVSDTGTFNLTLTKNINLLLDFDRYTKSGDSAASFDLDRKVVDSDTPVSEKMTQVGVGVEFHVARYGLAFEQRFQDYENTNSYFLAGPFNFKSNISHVRLNARPFNRLLLRGTAQFSDLDSDVTTLDGSGPEADVSGRGEFSRKINLYDLDTTLLLTSKIAVVGSVRYNTFGQTGSLTVDGETDGPDFGFKTLGLEGGLQYRLSAGFSLTAGYRYEKRTFTDGEGNEFGGENEESEAAAGTLETVTFTDTTVRNSFFGNMRWELKRLKFSADYQHGDYDDPFTLVSPTMFDRFRATVGYRLKNFNVTAGYLMSRTKNEIPGGVNFRIVYTEDDYSDLWKSSNDQINLRLGYASAKFNAGLGYSYIDFKTDSERLIAYNPYWTGPAGVFPWSIHYEGKSTLVDASVGIKPSPNWNLSASVNSYRNSGFWPLERLMFKAHVEYTFAGGFVSRLGYRYYDFKEKDSVLILKNNYKAGILELSFGYRWQ